METVYRFGSESSRGYVPQVQRNGSRPGADVRRRRREKERSKHEQGQGKTRQLLVSPVPGGVNEGTSASLMELDLPRIRGAHGEKGGAGNSGAAYERKRTQSNSPIRERLPMEEDANG